MRWTSDLATGALYFDLSSEPIHHQRELAPGLIVDETADGRLVGIEVLTPNARDALLAFRHDLGLRDVDFELVVAVIASGVHGDRERLGILEGPAVEARDQVAESPVPFSEQFQGV